MIGGSAGRSGEFLYNNVCVSVSSYDFPCVDKLSVVSLVAGLSIASCCQVCLVGSQVKYSRKKQIKMVYSRLVKKGRS